MLRATRFSHKVSAAVAAAARRNDLIPDRDAVSLLERRALLRNDYEFYRPPHYSTFYDFDAWVYGLQWPQMPAVLPMMNRLSVVADDIKFASNAWSLLRVCAFYGLPHPRVLSELRNTTPSMSTELRGNWKFYEHCTVSSDLNPKAAKVALMPSHPKAVSLADCDWHHLANNVSKDGTVEIVLGMENGMRQDVCDSCDAWLSIPQYGSCGSLSMLNALGIVMHSANSVLHPLAAQKQLFIGSTRAKALHNNNSSNVEFDENSSIRGPTLETINTAVPLSNYTLSNSLDGNGRPSSSKGSVSDMESDGLSSASSSSSAASTIPQEVHPAKKLHEGLHHSSAVGSVATDAEIEWLSTVKRDFTASRPHGDELLGLDDDAIAKLLAERRKHLPLQLATLHYNESGDRNIGAIIRNGNIYNFEKMVIVGRKKFSHRGSVGTHHYTNICYHKTFEEADADIEGYALWLLHNPYPYLCNRVDELLPQWELPKELSVGRKAAKAMLGAYMPHGHPLVQEWLAADNVGREGLVKARELQAADPNAVGLSPFGTAEEVCLKTSFGTKALPLPSCIDDSASTAPSCSWEASHPMYGVVVDQLKPTVHLDDEASIMAAVADVRSRGLKGIMLVVPEEGSTPVWPLLSRTERLVTVVHPARMCGSVQRGLTSAVSTAIALERLREATLLVKK